MKYTLLAMALVVASLTACQSSKPAPVAPDGKACHAPAKCPMAKKANP